MSERPGETSPARLSAVVTGRVQGVGFRYSTVDIARRLQLTGWVRNRHDGCVEIVAEGPRAQLERLARWSHEGPPGARVTHVATQWSHATGEFAAFAVRY
jgi:acylphosphatase